MFVLQILCLRCDTNIALWTKGSAEMRENMKERLEKNVGLIIYLVVWAALFCWFWLGQRILTGNEAIYALGAFYVLLPASALVVSVMYGGGGGKFRYIIPIILGLLEMLLGFLTFDLANILSNGKWNLWNNLDWSLCLFSLVPSLLGVAIGEVSKKMKK